MLIELCYCFPIHVLARTGAYCMWLPLLHQHNGLYRLTYLLSPRTDFFSRSTVSDAHRHTETQVQGVLDSPPRINSAPTLTPTLSLRQTCQLSRFWRDRPAFLPDVPLKCLNHGNVPLFVRSRIFFWLTLLRCPDVNTNHPIERNCGNYVLFFAKIPNDTAA